MRAIILLASYIVSTLGYTQQSAERPRVLTVSSSKTLTVPPFGFYGEPVCDANGNVFVHIDTSAYDHIELFELSHSGDSGVFFKLPSELAEKHHFSDFTVSPSGKAYVLSETFEGLYVLDFKSDGSLGSETLLEGTQYLTGGRLAVFDSGAILISGYFGERAPTNLKGKNFGAIFEGSGALRTRITEDLGKTNLDETSTKLLDGAVTVGEDGNAYMLHKNEIIIFSETGRIARHIPIKKADERAVGERLNVSGGVLAVGFVVPEKNHDMSRQYLLLNSVTGEPYGFYTASPDLGTQVLCFSREEGFTFLGRDEAHRLLKLTAAIR